MKKSAGVLLYRNTNGTYEVLLVHPGGPFWAKKDTGAWSIPKGEFTDEDGLAAAKREFREELGQELPDGELSELGSIKQSGGKQVIAWSLMADLDVKKVVSNTFEMEWPPRSGSQQSFPEVDKAGWFQIDKAKTKIVKGQIPLLENLEKELGVEPGPLAAEPPESKPQQPTQIHLF